MTDEDHIAYMLDGGTRGQIERLTESKDSIGFGGGLWLHAELPAFKESVGGPGPAPSEAEKAWNSTAHLHGSLIQRRAARSSISYARSVPATP